MHSRPDCQLRERPFIINDTLKSYDWFSTVFPQMVEKLFKGQLGYMLQGKQSTVIAAVNSKDVAVEPTHAAEVHIYQVDHNTKSFKTKSSFLHTSSFKKIR